MSRITYNASNFSKHWGKSLSGTHILDVSWHDLVWASITVGKPGIAYLLTHGWHSVSDAIVRSYTVYANLQQVGDRYRKSSLYVSMDPSEKRAASYGMGMIAAKILCARLLNIPWLLHLSMAGDVGVDIRLINRSEPDLIGYDINGNWVVAEAKGRTHAYNADAMLTAKTQTRQLRMINGAYPNLRVAIQAYFSPNLRFEIEDPEDYDDDAIDVNFDLDNAIRRYYSYPFETVESDTKKAKELDGIFHVKNLDEIGVTIGLHEKISKLLGGSKKIDIDALKNISIATEKLSTDTMKVFPDGISIELDERWTKEYMSKQPDSRKDI